MLQNLINTTHSNYDVYNCVKLIREGCCPELEEAAHYGGGTQASLAFHSCSMEGSVDVDAEVMYC